MLTWLWRPCASRISRACGLVASWLPFGRSQYDEEKIELQEAMSRFVIIHPGGAVMRNGPGIRSEEVGMLHRGEVVTVLKDSGRRACIRTREGVRAWISTVTADQVPIVRRVTAGMKVEEVPAEGASKKSNAVFADEFEKRWQEKWQRIRVNADDSNEGKPLSIRQGAPGMQINAWRPSGLPNKVGVFSDNLRKRRGDIDKVPRLDSPPAPSNEVEAPQSERSPTKKGVAAGEDLLDLDDTFETWPRAVARAAAAGGRQGVPSLVELFSSQRLAAVDLAPDHVNVDASGAGGESTTEAAGLDGTGKVPQSAPSKAAVATEAKTNAGPDQHESAEVTGAAVAGRSPSRPNKFSDPPPSRGYSMDTMAMEDMKTADRFDYLLKDFPEVLMRQVQQDVEEETISPYKHERETTSGLSTALAGLDYDAHADFSSDEEAEAHNEEDAAEPEKAPHEAILGEPPAESTAESEAPQASGQVVGDDAEMPSIQTLRAGESPAPAPPAHDSEEALRVLMQTYSGSPLKTGGGAEESPTRADKAKVLMQAYKETLVQQGGDSSTAARQGNENSAGVRGTDAGM
mmetsp:Transcript_44652/g.83848  ORF Transcript_44652/g.83848 Transcript_44652/m.83848 type:complete len:573 (-) Transcript_44652:50-1768(-)